MNIDFQTEVKPVLLLKIKDKEYNVEYKLAAVAAAERAVGKSLKSVTAWLELEWLDVPKVLHAGIAAHHPDVTIEEIQDICDELGAEGCLVIRYALTRLNFPKYLERAENAVAARARAGAGAESPNVQSGAER